MKHIPENASIIDVRTPEEFAQDHFPGAVNIPLDEIQRRHKEFEHMQPPIITYCRSGNRSGLAMQILQQCGIREVQNGGALNDLLQLKK